MSNKNPFIINKYSLMVALLIVIKQVIVATSTLWIVNMGQSINDSHSFIFYFALFSASLIIVYIPGALSNYFLDLSIFKSFQRYIARFNHNHYGHAELSRDVAYKKNHEPYLVSEGFSVINELHLFYYNYFEIALNIILSVIALSYLVNQDLFIAYFISMLLVVAVIKLFSTYIKHATAAEQSSRIDMVQVLTQQWDNVLIGNDQNYDCWRQHFKLARLKAQETKVKNTLWVELSTTIASFIGFIPIVYFLLETITEAAGDTLLLTALIATLPRQITTVHYLSDIAYFSNQFTALNTRINGLRKSLILTQTKSPATITWEQIKLQETTTQQVVNQHHSFDTVSAFISPKNSGRYLISGPNGCGKSSLLLQLKSHFKDSAYYLPTHSDLLFKDNIDSNLSSGERQRNALNNIQALQGVTLLLLDEWDANLDKNNKQQLSRLLDDLSQTCCIVEVRHRH